MIISKAIMDDACMLAENNLLLAIESEGEPLEYDTVLDGVRAVLDDETKGFYLIARENDAIIGQLMITYEWSDWRNECIWWVQSVYVSKDHRKSGVFSKLVEDVRKRARKADVSRLRLYVHITNTLAIDVYRHTSWDEGHYLLFETSVKQS